MKTVQACEMRKAGASVPQIAEALGVNARTIRKWFARSAPKIDKNEPEDFKILELNEVYELLRDELSRDAQALAKAKPGSRAMQWQRIAKALLTLASLPAPEPASIQSDAILAELSKRLEALAGADQPPPGVSEI